MNDLSEKNEFIDNYFDVNLSKSDFENNLKELKTKFSNMPVEEVYKKNKRKYNVTISEDRINSLVINAPLADIKVLVLLFVIAPILLFIVCFGSIFYMSEELFYLLIHSPQMFVILFILVMFGIFIFISFKFFKLGFYELRFEGKILKICRANKVIEKNLNENTRFILDSNYLSFFDMETKETKPLLVCRELYVANFFAYKMNSYLLKVLEN